LHAECAKALRSLLLDHLVAQLAPQDLADIGLGRLARNSMYFGRL